MAAKWYRTVAGKDVGPIDAATLVALAASGDIHPDEMIWRNGLEEWVPAKKVKGLKFPDTTPIVSVIEPEFDATESGVFQTTQESRLMTCPDCGAAVSARAAACPKCGCPFRETSRPVVVSPPITHVTIEHTSKNLKAMLAFCVILCLVGCPGTMIADESLKPQFASTFAIGFLGFVITKVVIWWEHG